jgi:hypothetical protein
VNEKIEEDKKNVSQKERMTGTAPSASIQLSTFENWDQVGSWYYGLQHDVPHQQRPSGPKRWR